MWSVTDTSGNSVTCTYDITVIDNIAPSIINCGAGDQTVNVDANECNYTKHHRMGCNSKRQLYGYNHYSSVKRSNHSNRLNHLTRSRLLTCVFTTALWSVTDKFQATA
ncbi:MAG: hypothetical protein HS119_11595 [Flavobacteriales bacterium]|nr:hypothetical protein [Flavobacteriales bacterium]